MSMLSRVALFALLMGSSFLGASTRFPGTATALDDEYQIRQVLQGQTEAWNQGDIDRFMAGYWNSEETAFVGASGITRGWRAVLDRYKKNYPDRKTMGRLSFAGLEVHILCPEAAFAIGQFQLERDNDRPSGVFTLNFRKFSEGWRIIEDHTTGFSASSH